MAHNTATDHAHEHPSDRKYVEIAIILTIITAIEVAIYYVEWFHDSGALVPTLIVLSLAFIGCAKQGTEPEPGLSDSIGSPGVTANPPVPLSTPPVGPDLQVIDEKQFAQILEEHRGEVVLVDFWATWCIECLELMPHTVELQKQLGDQGLRVVLVSLDSPEDRRVAITKLLAKNGVDFDSYISRYGGDAKWFEAFEIEVGALPNIKLYDQKGELRKVFSAGRMPPEPFEAEDIEKAVRALLAEK